MKIKNIEGLSIADLQTEVNSGGKFVTIPMLFPLLL